MDYVTFVLFFGVVLIGVAVVLALYFAKKDDERKKKEMEEKEIQDQIKEPVEKERT